MKEKETERCTGHCCKDFSLPLSPMEIEFDAKRANKMGKGRWGDIKIIADMVRLIRIDYQASGGSQRGRKKAVPRRQKPWDIRNGDASNRVYHYTCRHFDQTTGNCLNYDKRPTMCREYPYGRSKPNGACSYEKCTRRCTIDESEMYDKAEDQEQLKCKHSNSKNEAASPAAKDLESSLQALTSSAEQCAPTAEQSRL